MVSEKRNTKRKKETNFYTHKQFLVNKYIKNHGILIEGELSKQGEKGPIKGWKVRKFILTSDKIIRYYNGPKEMGSIPLSSIASVNNSAALDKPLDFNFVTPNRTYYLRAASLEEKQKWVLGIDRIVNPTDAGSVLKKKGKKAVKGVKKTLSDAEKKVKYGDKSDEEIAKIKKKKKKEKLNALEEKEKLRQQKEKEKLKVMGEKEKERHEKAKEKIKASG